MKRPTGLRRRFARWSPPGFSFGLRDVIAIGAVAALLVAVLVASVVYPPSSPGSVTAGFGLDWECTPTPGYGQPICLKKVAPK